MAANSDTLITRLRSLTEPGARNQLVAKGLARGLVWRDGRPPEGMPSLGESLSADLLDHGYTVLATALSLRQAGQEPELTANALRISAEAIESAVRRGEMNDESRGFHLLVAAAAFHIAGFAARAYCLIPSDSAAINLSSCERVLALLIRRRLNELRQTCLAWLEDPAHSDDEVARRLLEDESFDAEDALTVAFSRTFHRAVAFFDFAIEHGRAEALEQAVRLLEDGIQGAAETRFVPMWWVFSLTRHLIGELWDQSLHRRIPMLPGGDDYESWERLRTNFIFHLCSRDTAEVDLWPSQLEAATRATDPTDDLVVALPTSAGKTRIAELCILRALAQGKRVVYVTPLRALSGQVEKTLSRTFRPLGFSVSSLYGASGVAVADVGTLKSAQIVVSTPEKLDFALRQSPELLDDVALIVLDEGHMIGLGSREVRYEVLVQRLLKRGDASSRRLVCLSAVFSPGEAFNDFTQWLRSDQPGSAINFSWRPTRQRSGVLRWMASAGRLDLEVEGEYPFVPRFVLLRAPKGRRRNPFPQNQNELVIAAALRFHEDGNRVLIYSPLRGSVETLAKLCVTLAQQGYLPALLRDPSEIARAKQVGLEWLGAEHVAVKALDLGIAVHHGALPRPFLTEIETLLNDKVLPVAIASPTLAQGIDLSCSALLFHTIYRNKGTIPPSEYANVIGRAGRAFVDLDGISVYPIFPLDPQRAKMIRDYFQLRNEARNRQLESGLLQLINEISRELCTRTGHSSAELLESALNQDVSWEAPPVSEEAKDVEALLADLDTAILATADELECPIERLADMLDAAVRTSLWQRRLSRLDDSSRNLQVAMFRARAHWIWTHSSGDQRRGFFSAGLGYQAGHFIDSHLDTLVQQLLEADASITNQDLPTAVKALTTLAELLMEVHPFRLKERPDSWSALLSGWIQGRPLNELLTKDAPDEVEFIQDGVVYRLVWAVEAVRVHALAVGSRNAELIMGGAALSLTYGVPSIAAALLAEAGLPSREMAIELTERFEGQFTDSDGMDKWLESVVPPLEQAPIWREPEVLNIWHDFVNRWQAKTGSTWARAVHELEAVWDKVSDQPPPGAPVRLVPRAEKGGSLAICSEDLTPLGRIASFPTGLLRGHLTAEVASQSSQIRVSRFGPRL